MAKFRCYRHGYRKFHIPLGFTTRYCHTFFDQNENYIVWIVLWFSVEREYKYLFSSPELKAQVSFSDHFLSIVCLPVCLLTFHIFIFFSRTTGPMSTKLGTRHPWVKRIQVCSNEGPHPFPRGDNSKKN